MLPEEFKARFTTLAQQQQLEKALEVVKNIKTDDKIYNFEFAKHSANILLHVMADHTTVIAAFYYPFFVTQKITAEQIEAVSGKEVVTILTTLLKVEQLKINTRESQTQNIKNMFLALAKDIRVIILKLAIVQQTVANLKHLDKPEQQDLMHQVKEIYAPLAAMIGIGYIKSTLENETFLFYKPMEYANLNKELHKYFEIRNNQIKKSIEDIKQVIKPIDAKVYGRHKQISSIYKKLVKQNSGLNNIFDILAVRVIVNTIEDCYAAVGKIHSLYVPMGRFKDYIAQPKENGYQSLHTTVLVENGDPLEIQIRTKDMHNYAEYGFAAHWAYKEKRKVNESDKKINYIRSVMELYKEKSPEEMLDALKIDVYSGDIFVQTPMGKVIQFSEGATPVDFAYAIHSKIGDTCVGAKVNGKMVPLNTQLQNGDIVEIVTNSGSKGPSRDWLKFVKADARGKINAFFRRERKDENIKRGKSMLESGAKAKNITLSNIMQDAYLEVVYDKYSLSSLEDMYASIGYGGLTVNQVLNRLTNLYNEEHKETPVVQAFDKRGKKALKNAAAVNVLGYANLMTKFAGCCNPLPGDDIVGYVSRGKGVTIHRTNCPSIQNIEEERLIECSWNKEHTQGFLGALTVVATNSPNSIATVSKKIGDLKVEIASLKSMARNAERMTLHVHVYVKRKEELADIINKVNALSCVLEIYRGV